MYSRPAIDFHKDNLDRYLLDLAKEYKKRAGRHMAAEVVLIGGASILINYGFREMTSDIDALIHASSYIKEAIYAVADKHHLPNDWFNEDFMKTSSYTLKLWEVSKYYKNFAQVLQVRTISAEYLVAMKLRSGRNYKHDLSDIMGIVIAHKKAGQPLGIERIKQAYCYLYGDLESLPESSKDLLQDLEKLTDYELLYQQIIELERQSASLLQENMAEARAFFTEKPGISQAELFAKLREKQKNRPLKDE